MPDEEQVVENAISPPTSSILETIEAWYQEHFAPISLPPHTKAHIERAVADLKERLTP